MNSREWLRVGREKDESSLSLSSPSFHFFLRLRPLLTALDLYLTCSVTLSFLSLFLSFSLLLFFSFLPTTTTFSSRLFVTLSFLTLSALSFIPRSRSVHRLLYSASEQFRNCRKRWDCRGGKESILVSSKFIRFSSDELIGVGLLCRRVEVSGEWEFAIETWKGE